MQYIHSKKINILSTKKIIILCRKSENGDKLTQEIFKRRKKKNAPRTKIGHAPPPTKQKKELLSEFSCFETN